MRLGASTNPQTVRVEQQPGVWQCLRLVAAIAVFFLTASSSALQSQTKTTTPGPRKAAPRKSSPSRNKMSDQKAAAPDLSWLQDLLKDKELMADLGKLGEKLKAGIEYPAARSQSKILPRLPESTLFYVALSNYGDTIHQALQIFQQELRESAPLRAFLQKNKLDTLEPKIESGIQKFYEFSQFLGDEVIITGKMQGQEPAILLVAEVKKPGVKEFLEKLNNEEFTDKGDRLRIFDPQQLAASDLSTGQHPVVLVRPDLVVVGFSVASLRDLNAQIDQGGPRFISNPLGQRVAKFYQGGTNGVFGIDLHKLVGLIPQSKSQERMMLEKSGFADVTYLATENTLTAGRSASQMELAFNGPRHGIASWLAAPAPMGGLDFVSSKAAIAGDVMLKNPAQIFDDIVEIAGNAALAALPQMEAQFNVNLKQDLLSKLSGEIAFEMQQPPMMVPGAETKTAAPKGPGAFKFILRVLDPVGLQQTLARLLVMAPMESGKREEDGVTFHTLTSPSASGPPTEINYFFMDGYLVIASDAAIATEAVRQHRKGESLANSSKLREALTKGQPTNASMMLYQDAGQAFGAIFAQMPPEMQQLLPNIAQVDIKPNVFYLYGEESSVRGTTSDNINVDLSVAMMIGAAVAIPNLLRARISANEAAAASTVRTMNTAQVTYSVTYPRKGYAPHLAALGPPHGGNCSESDVTPAHACLLDDVIGNASCTAGKWCPKGAYRYSVRGTCTQTKCSGYVVTATPVSADKAKKSFCSINDAVVRMHLGAPLETPLTAAGCRAWAPIQ